MPDVVKHAWTHRPRAQGGTDPIEMPGGQPFALATLSGTATLESDLEYSLCAGNDDGFGGPASVGNATGLADHIYIGNDPNNETFYVSGYPNFCISIQYHQQGIYAYDLFVEFVSNFTGTVTMFPDSDFQIWDVNDPVTAGGPYHLREWRTFGGSDPYTVMRMSGLAYLGPITGNQSANRLSFEIQQFSGSDQDIDRGWALITKVADGNADQAWP